MRRFSLHPACKLFPKLAQRELRELADDIKANRLNVERVKEINANAPKLIDRIRSGELNVPAAKRMAGHEVRKERKAFALGVPSFRFDSGLSRHEPTLGRAPKTVYT